MAILHPPSDAPPKPRYPPAAVGDYDPRSTFVQRKYLPLVVGLSPVTAWRMLRRGEFPAPIQLSRGRVAWRRTDLEQWLSTRERGGVK
jgi:prophage regulatory protein